MKKYNLVIAFLLLVLMGSCVKNSEDYYISPITNHNRSIVAASVPNQVGTTVITNNDSAKTVTLECIGQPSDLSAIKLQLALSDKATVSPALGATTDFSKTSDHSVTFTVKAQSGQTSTWKVYCNLYQNPYQGSWTINDFEVTWDDGNGYGNAGTGKVADKLAGTQAGLDDIITFGTVSITNGIISGDYSRTAGADGQFASYVNTASSQRDWSAEFGQLPAGTGTYYINADNTITIVVNGVTYDSKGMDASNSTANQMDYELTPSPEDNSLINWSNYYGDFDNIACCSHKIWYILDKK